MDRPDVVREKCHQIRSPDSCTLLTGIEADGVHPCLHRAEAISD